MHAKLLIPALAVLSLGSGGCYIGDFGDGMRYHRDFHYSFPISSRGRVEVETFNGSVEITTWDQNTVDISGSKWGPTESAADALRIDTDHTADSVSIRAVRPSEWRSNLGAHFEIKVPKGAVLDRIVTSNGPIRTEDCAGPARMRTSNGSIHVQGLQGRLDAQTSNGSIELMDVTGDATLHTSNGHIHAQRLNGAADAETSNGGIDLELPGKLAHDVRAHTSNSGITVRLQEPLNAHVMASTSNSSIHTDFDVRMSGEFSKRRLEGSIGSGGPMIDLSTSNGSIRILKM
ncbi:MAG TPA: DUF4097 family beta strand repeat-containing protein [Bryobacteraceae bacterium]|nr:DUF4097 family beta strand repeat-containing protein [Bryobacteraceae bacterium]